MARTRWTWRPDGLGDLSRIRHEVGRTLTTHVAVDADLVDEIVAALDELMSNALRHGRTPVDVEVGVTHAAVVLCVSDRAVEAPPRPTATRDPALGGMGLGIVARSSSRSGWFARDDVKVVWAELARSAAAH